MKMKDGSISKRFMSYYYQNLIKTQPHIFKWKISNDNGWEVEQGFATLFLDNGKSYVFMVDPNVVKTICEKNNLIYSYNPIENIESIYQKN